MAGYIPVIDKGHDAFQRVRTIDKAPIHVGCLESPSVCRLYVLELTARGQVLSVQGVDEIVQAALRYILRVLLLERTSGGVAWIGIEFFTVLRTCRVESFELGPHEEDLTTRLKFRGKVTT